MRWTPVAFVFCAFATLMSAQPLTSGAAAQLVQTLMAPEAFTPGSYRQVANAAAAGRGPRNVTYILRESETVVWQRFETTLMSPGPNSTPGPRQIFITTPEGTWHVLPMVAIFTPKTPEPPTDESAKPDREKATREEFRRHLVCSGEQFESDGRKLIRVSAKLSAQGIAFVMRTAGERMGENLPAPMKLAISTVAGPAFAAEMPVQWDWVVDENLERVYEHHQRSLTGKELQSENNPAGRERKPFGSEKIAPLPKSMFEPPPGTRQIRASTPREGGELVEKFRPRIEPATATSPARWKVTPVP